MQFRELFSLKIRHTFYKDGECPDFTVAPTVECARILQNHRLLWRPTRSGFLVLTGLEKTTKKMFLPLPKGLIFRFLMQLDNPEFVRFTDLAASYKNKMVVHPVFFQSKDSGLVLAVKELEDFHTDQFDLENGGMLENKSRLFVLGNKPRSGTTTKQIKLEGIDSTVLAFAANTNTIEVAPGTRMGKFRATYPIQPQAPQGYFGRIDIQLKNQEAATNDFEIKFSKSSAIV